MSSPSTEAEQVFLREIALHPDDNTTRLIYADWLDEQGDPRGEYLRIHCELARLPRYDARFSALLEREKELQLDLDAEWLQKIEQPRIQNCEAAETAAIQFDYECPKAWRELTVTQHQDVRHCSACQQEVFFCHSMPQLKGHVRLGHCVAIGPELLHPLPEEPPRPEERIQFATMGIIEPERYFGDEDEEPEMPSRRSRKKSK